MIKEDWRGGWRGWCGTGREAESALERGVIKGKMVCPWTISRKMK